MELGRGGRRGWKPEIFTKDVLSVGAWGPLLGCAESQVLLYAATAHSLAHCLMLGNHLIWDDSYCGCIQSVPFCPLSLLWVR